MERTIIGFDQDEMGDWRAILICGHRQHIRHNPPLVSRPWVLTEEGRSRFLGVALDCKACDEGEPVSDAMVLPDALEAIYTQFHTDLHRFILSRLYVSIYSSNRDLSAWGRADWAACSQQTALDGLDLTA